MSENDTTTPKPNPAPSPLPAPAPLAGTTPAQGSQGITVLLTLVIVLLIAFLVVFISKRNTGTGTDAGIDAIRQQNELLKAEFDAERKARGLPVFDSKGVTNIAERMSKDAGLLVQTVAELETTLSKKEESISGTTQSLLASQQLNSNLSVQVQNLENQLAQLRVSAQDAPQLRAQVTQLSADLELERGKLLEFSRRPTSQELADVKRALEDELARTLTMQGENSRLLSELELNQSRLADVNPATLELLKTELEQLRPENKTLRREVQRLQAELDGARLFVQSSDNLSPKAAALYAGLKQLEGLTLDQLEGAYGRIGDTLNAEVIHQVKFEEGESHVTFTDVEEIKSKLAATTPDSFFLVVGYASNTGDSTSNQKLSAQRATRSASVVNTLKAESQDVRAVYLGQTNRFSSDDFSKNQLCEIWKLN